MLVRKGSKANLRGHEDMQRCLDQKNTMICSLESEIEELRVNQERHDRSYNQLSRRREKYDKLAHQYDSLNERNQQKVQLGVKSSNQLRIQMEHLQSDLSEKLQGGRDAKFQTQLLVQNSQQKDQELTQIKGKTLEARNHTEILKFEQQRLKAQISIMREEMEKQKKDLSTNKKNSEAISDKIYKTNNYIRNLNRQETLDNQRLCRIEDDSSYVDMCLEQMEILTGQKNGEAVQIHKEIEQMKYGLATKENDKKKLEKEHRQKQKILQVQRQKSKTLSQQVEQKKNELNRMVVHQKASSEEVNEFIKSNSEVSEVNQQLKDDLDVCLKHLQNLGRMNKSLDGDVNRLQEINKNVIQMLQNPPEYRKWGSEKSSRATTFEFQN